MAMFRIVPWIGLHSVSVAFCSHMHLLVVKLCLSYLAVKYLS